MADRRIELHNKLKSICKNVYFHPPDGYDIEYPCIVYNRVVFDVNKANNKVFIKDTQYDVTYITRKPDDTINEQIFDRFPYSRMTNTAIVDKLYHEYYSIQY